MAKRVTSRLAKRKRKQLTRQTIILATLAILIIALFVFVILPNVIRLFFNIFAADSGQQYEDVIPPQQPAIHAPPVATNSAKLNLSGYTEPETSVHLVINNQQQDEVQADEEGWFDLEAKLTKSSNKIGLYSQDEAGNESETAVYQVQFDAQAPEIKLAVPKDGDEFHRREDRVIEIKGETESKAKILVNNLLTYANEQGEFSLRYPLEKGENKLEIKAIDQAGNYQQTEINVKYRD